MSRFPPARAAAHAEPVRARTFGVARGWLLLAMGLAGILTVALIVTADRSYAGIDGMRALSVQAPAEEQDPPRQAASTIPLLRGIVAVIHDIAPMFFAAAPAADPRSTAPQPSPQPASTAAPAALPTSSPTLPLAPTPTAPATPTPTPKTVATPPATSTPAPTAPATPAPTATPAATAVPTLAVSTDRGATAIVNVSALVPGDRLSRTIAVQNSGGLGFKYTVSATQTAATLLWTDAASGLQLTVQTTGGAVLYSGPLAGLGYLAGPSVLAPGASETLRYIFEFPASAANGFQGLSQDLRLVFDAVQYP